MTMLLNGKKCNLCKYWIHDEQDTRYLIFQIRAPGGHDTTFIISTYTINKVNIIIILLPSTMSVTD